MMSRVRSLMAVMALVMGVALVGCADKGLRAYVSGWDGMEAADRERLAEHEAQSRLTLLDDLETAEELDYIVLVPLPDDRAEAAAGGNREVMSRMEWFAMVSEHSEAQEIGRVRNIPVIELPRLFDLLEPAAPQPTEETPAEQGADEAEAADAEEG